MSSAVREESAAISRIETAYMNRHRNSLYIALEGLDFIWSPQEIREFRQMWRQGFSPDEIAEYFEREDPLEVIILAMCQIRRGRIRQRKGGFMGTK